MPQRRRLWTSISLATLCVASGWSQSPTTAEAITPVYQELIQSVDRANVRQTYREIAALGSRVAGSEGEAKTFAYVERRFRELGLTNIRREPFNVTVPDPESRGRLTLPTGTVELFPLWPNLVRTSTCDVEGPLLYGGNGTLEALRGKEVRGSIVVLEFSSGPRWRNAAKLGARAVIFLDAPVMVRAEAERKISSVPVDMPRFLLPRRIAAPVLNAALKGQRVRLQCRQDWVTRPSQNLFADVPGSGKTYKGEPVILSAYADSMSVAPGLAPGAESIANIAALLETARIYAKRGAGRPLTVMLSGAHSLALQGAREFVSRRFDSAAKPEPNFLNVTLDLTSGSRTIGAYARGWFYEYRDEPIDAVRSVARAFRSHADRLAPVFGDVTPRLVLTDAVNNSDARTWKNNIPGKFAFDAEPLTNAGYRAITLATIEDGRERVDTPSDTVDQVQFPNVFRQIQTTVAMMHHALNDTSNKNENSDFKIAIDPSEPKRMSLIGGFCKVTGRVVVFDPERSFVPDDTVPYAIGAVLGRQPTLMGVRGNMLHQTGKDAKITIDGLAPISSYWGANIPMAAWSAFRIDPKTGAIDRATSLGLTGAGWYPSEFELKTAIRSSPIVVFPCVPVTLFDLVDPQDLRPIGGVDVLNAQSGSEPDDYGVFSANTDVRLNSDLEDVQVLFVPPGIRFQMLGGSRRSGLRLILTNTTPGNEAGRGYIAAGRAEYEDKKATVEGRDEEALNGYFRNLPLNTARDITELNAIRLKKFDKYRIISAGVNDLQKLARDEIAAAEAAEKAKDWPNLDRHARAAWGYALRAHPVVMTTANDVVTGVIFYLFLLIPFSYFVERLIVAHRILTKQLAVALSVFFAAFVLLRLIHPAFEIVTNPTMIFVGFVMGALSLIVISFILSKFEASLREIKQSQSGIHEVDIRRTSVALAAFNLGVSNMRRRKARTVLTTLTLVVMTFIVLSFTSIVSELQLNETASPNTARYGGLLVRNPGMEPLQSSTYRQIANEFSGRGTVVRRAFYYGADVGDTGVLTLQRADRVAEVRAMVGMDPEETEVLRPQDSLLPGGRWFRPGERDVVILPSAVAETLRVSPREVGTAKITYGGSEYTVIGILDGGILRAGTDLDGDAPLPPDFSLSNRYQQESGSANQAFRSFIRLEPNVCFFVPTETALNLGSDLRTVAVAFKDPAETRKALDALMPRLRLNLYASVPEGEGLAVKQFSVLQANKGTGIALIVVQMAIAAIFVLNTMVASVYERTREIAIFSSIGLAPNHIAMLFFAESLVYGVLGAVSGYIFAQLSAKAIVTYDLLPGLYLNFSSTSAVLSAGLVMGTVILSTIYPARKASQIAAPAQNEQAFETEPEGDEWTLPLPFSISASEAGPIIQFLGQWLRAYQEYTIGDFVTANTQTGRKGEALFVEATTWLAPYDLGISQSLHLEASPSNIPDVYKLDLTLTRLAGDPENWPTVNRRFLANLRKQFLTWRTLDADQRRKYEEMSAPEPVAPA